MADTPRPVEINGLVFASTSGGHLLEGEVRRHVEALQRELAELHARLEHLTSLERLAQATVVKADELAAEIEAEARRRAEEMADACETELVERRRQFEIETGAQQAAAQSRVAQLQAALEGTLQTLGRALQAAGAPALEMPAASAPAWTPSTAPAAGPGIDANGHEGAVDAAAPATAPAENEQEPYTRFGMPSALWRKEEAPPAAEAEPVGREAEAERDAWQASAEPDFAAEGARAAAGGDERAGDQAGAVGAGGSNDGWGSGAYAAPSEQAALLEPEAERAATGDEAAAAAAPGQSGSGTYELTRPSRSAPEPTPIRPSMDDRVDDQTPALGASPEPGPTTLSRIGPETLEIDMRPVKSFADLARVTKLLGRIAPGAQPVDLNLPQHRALFSVRGKDPQALAAQLQEALPEAKVVEREDGLDVLLEGGE